MKKEDLKTGMRLTTRGGLQAIVLKGTSNGDIVSCIGSAGAWRPFDNVNIDSAGNGNSTDEFVKVEDANTNKDFLHQYRTIWESQVKKTKEYTMEEAIKKMGHEFKIKK